MKMKKTRKRIALLIMLCMLTMLLPVGTGYANEQESNDMDYIFSGNNNATLIKYKGKESHVEIPSTVTHNGTSYSVEKIKEGAFAGCTDIISITIPKSVESILGKAFTGCSNLEAFHVVEENTAYCAVDGVLFKKIQGEPATLVAYPANKASTSYTIPESVTYIFGDAFQSSPNLQSITIANGNQYYSAEDGVLFDIQNSKKELFKYPEGNTASTYKIPGGVTAVINNAFFNCTNLKNITISAAMTGPIESEAFSGSTKLTEFKVEDGNAAYSAEDGVLFNEDKTKLFLYPKGKDGAYIIPESVKTIEAKAFQNCSSLTSITIPQSVTAIGDYSDIGAFSGCTGLTNVTFDAGSALQSIARGTFENCSSLTSIIIPQNVYKIDIDAFSGCSNLRLVTFEDDRNLQSVEYNAFHGCSDDLYIIYNGNAISAQDWQNAGIKPSQVKTQVNPTKPTLQLQSRTSKTITLKAEPEIQGTPVEYRMQGGIWQTLPTFTGLTPNTSYTFEARYQATTLATPSGITTETFTTLAETASSGWSPSASGPTLNITGQEHTLTITPNADWLVEAVSVDGTPVVVTDGVMVLEHIYSWSKVSVSFAKKPEAPVKDNSKLVSGVKQTKLYASSKSLKQNKIRLTWRKANGYKVDYYLVYRAAKKNGKYQLVYTTKRADQKSYTGIRTTKSGKRYYYKIRGVRLIDDKKYYTKDSNIISRK